MIIEHVHDLPSWDGSEGLLAIIVRGDAGPGVKFVTHPSDRVQVGMMSHPAGHVIPAHLHNVLDRPAARTATQEVLVIRRGWMDVSFFDRRGRPVGLRRVGAGEVLILLTGGHGMTVGDDGVEMVEVKQGPFLGRDVDKTDLAMPIEGG